MRARSSMNPCIQGRRVWFRTAASAQPALNKYPYARANERREREETQVFRRDDAASWGSCGRSAKHFLREAARGTATTASVDRPFGRLKLPRAWDFVEAQANLVEARRTYRPNRDGEARFGFGMDMGATARVCLAMTTWLVVEVGPAQGHSYRSFDWRRRSDPLRRTSRVAPGATRPRAAPGYRARGLEADRACRQSLATAWHQPWPLLPLPRSPPRLPACPAASVRTP
jgi:hypothetical protein